MEILWKHDDDDLRSHRCKTSLRKSTLRKTPLLTKTRYIKLGRAIIRVPTGPQHPVAVEEPSAVLGYIQPDTANGIGEVSLNHSRDTGRAGCLIQERSSHVHKYREKCVREMGISVFQEKMQNHSAFPVEIWQGSKHNKAEKPT